MKIKSVLILVVLFTSCTMRKPRDLYKVVIDKDTVTIAAYTLKEAYEEAGILFAKGKAKGIYIDKHIVLIDEEGIKYTIK
ncbi:hypothetical protein [Pedobacter sp. ASV28]|uniref:hypothetical protein n=1 Tax=Pedobacter sp. ASV28 TaxID=2795123 RepID=UPI0018EC9FB0|nr:hypothetical protein [Pedobacter sp. ASV28]